jgi:DNA-directed RNA polymerase
MYQGVGGEVRDMVSVMRACLTVGRLERAGAIVRRLAKCDINPAELLEYHHEYLEAAVDQLIRSPSEGAAQALHKWFEVEIRNKGLATEADTVAYMLKASMQSPPGGRRDRLVRRYMEIVGLEALKVGGILSDEELAHITQIAPTFNYPQGSADEVSELSLAESELTEGNAATVQKEVPQVVPTEQKGLGLHALKRALSLFEQTPVEDFVGPDAQRERQRRLEEDSVRSAIERWRHENSSLSKLGLNTSLQTKNIGARMWSWHVAFEERLMEELRKIEISEVKTDKNAADADRCTYGPFLRLLSPEKVAAITILSVMSFLTSVGVEKGVTLSSSITSIGNSIEDESIAEAIRENKLNPTWGKNARRHRSKRLQDLINKSQSSMTEENLEQNSHLGNNEPTKVDMSNFDQQWSAIIRAKIGAVLLEILIDTAKVPVTRRHPETGEKISQMQPALTHSHQYKMGKKVGVVMANPALVEQLKREPVHALLAKHLPMVVEPEPWSRFNKGGFLATPAKMMRIKLGDKDQRHYAEAAIGRGDLDQVFKGLDVLGKTPWRINRPVFDTMLEAWNSGKAIAKIAPHTPELEYPPEPPTSQDPSERRKWIKAVKAIENQRSGLHSQRCFQNFQLEIARSLRNETFYFPHNVDFRGRAYPIPPYLNHMGADHCRGLLMFGKGRELGANGLKWLKVHLANVFGYDKASLQEREDFAMDHLTDVYDSATNPLNGKRWWLQAEDAWQTLAACFELKAALDSPDPTKFVSYLPIHQDGTCNGLQHYAALGGDEWGASQVNLVPGDRPADVYTAVADLVKESMAEDLKRGHPHAKVLDGKITRKVVKQTVMTNVYGVTFIGAKAQVRKQLVAAYPDLPNDDLMNAGHLASYIATKIFKALSTMFRGAHDIQYWLGECANRISVALTPEQINRIERNHLQLFGRADADTKSLKAALDDFTQFKSSVIWTTPLHMPVVQPYRVSKSKTISTNLQRISLSEPHRSDPVSKRKQLQGFPPNFVHSLDATHMLLSALKCDELGLSFAAVHDSFWTHAADIGTMNDVLRDAFVRIHEEDVIGRLAAEFEVRYKDCFYLAKVSNKTLISKKITQLRKSLHYRNVEAQYLQGKGTGRNGLQVSELILERKRLQLLRSDDPAKVAEGKAMITPGSIFEEMAAEEDLLASEDMTDIGIGDISSKGNAREHDDVEVEEGETIGEDADGPLSESTAADMALGEEDISDDAIETSTMRTESEKEASFAKKVGSTFATKRQVVKQWLWLPLKFPPVPKKVCHYTCSPQ